MAWEVFEKVTEGDRERETGIRTLVSNALNLKFQKKNEKQKESEKKVKRHSKIYEV